MAIKLYREGDSHLIDNHPCMIGLFDECEINYQLDRGWFKSVSDIFNKSDEIESAVVHPIRLKAREAGIDGWDKRRIKKLEAELNGTEEG